jgi:hypothetical protein
MQARKIILETDHYGRLANQPSFPPNTRIEAIFLIIGKIKEKYRRKPSSIIAKKGKILGDILSSVTPHEDWDVLK